ncbi:MAG: 50S ribosomal protein L32 [Acidobacteria bacterium]|nr:50S ribosomal protein L32 [Acidobacteriota bacterium]
MAVQQNKKSPSKRGMHRAHDSLSDMPLAIEPTTRLNPLPPTHPHRAQNHH